LEKAQAWTRERGRSVTDEVNYLGEYELLTLARTRLAEHSFEGVGQLLERLLALAETQKRTGSMIEILLTQALLYQAQGNRPQALAALERSLTLAEPEGYLRTFVEEGERLRSLILDFRLQIEKQKHLGIHPLVGYLDKLLTAFPQPAATAPKSKIEHLKSEIVEPLSARELEVLRLLRSELSGPEIAQRLIVSLNTLRTHTKNIFNKLGVNNRRAAVRRAEELDLF
jgi:LuxR family maltose regulon positive regulatory protein